MLAYRGLYRIATFSKMEKVVKFDSDFIALGFCEYQIFKKILSSDF